MGFLDEKKSLTKEYNAADTLRAGTAPGLIDLVDKVTQGGNHVFFGEPHVDGMAIKQYETLANNYGIFRAAAHNGVKHLALEFPSSFQPEVDDFMAGKISQGDFKAKLSEQFISPWLQNEQDKADFTDSFTRTISNARAAGMQVHLADVTWQDIIEVNNKMGAELAAWGEQVTAKHERENSTIPLEEYSRQEFAKLPKDEQEVLSKQAEEFQSAQVKHFDSPDEEEAARHKRLDDSEQYSYLRERIPQGEGIMGVVGMSHLDNNLDEKRNHKTRGIDDYLTEEGGKVTTIEMHTIRSRAIVQDSYQQAGVHRIDPPDYTVILDKKAIIWGEDTRIGWLDKPLSEPKESLATSYRQPGLTPTPG